MTSGITVVPFPNLTQPDVSALAPVLQALDGWYRRASARMREATERAGT